VDRSENIGDMKRTVIDMLADSLPVYFFPPASLPSTDEAELWDFIKKASKVGAAEEVPSFLLIVYETESSFVGKEVILQLSRYPSVRVIRFHKKNKIYERLGLEGWPAAGYLKRDHSSGSILLGKNQNLEGFLTKSVISLAGLPDDL
jgi:hypothetical protein